MYPLYDKSADGQILNVPISPGSGYSFLTENIGLIDNKGIELSLRYQTCFNKKCNMVLQL